MRLVSAGPLFFLAIAATACLGLVACSATPKPPRFVELHRDVRVDADSRRVEVRGRIACRQGFLEQVACGRGSREHESLLVVDAPASVLHAALLAAGLRAGHPGSWHAESDGSVRLEPPEGDAVRLQVRWMEQGEPREAPIETWLTQDGPRAEPAAWVFAGSAFRRIRGTETYLADGSGSLVGLVTFGDEVVALRQVLPDRVAIKPPVFRARTDAMPETGAEVTLILTGSP